MAWITDTRISLKPLFATSGGIAIPENISEKGMWLRKAKSRLQAKLSLLNCFPNLTFKDVTQVLKIRVQT